MQELPFRTDESSMGHCYDGTHASAMHQDLYDLMFKVSHMVSFYAFCLFCLDSRSLADTVEALIPPEPGLVHRRSDSSSLLQVIVLTWTPLVHPFDNQQPGLPELGTFWFTPLMTNSLDCLSLDLSGSAL